MFASEDCIQYPEAAHSGDVVQDAVNLEIHLIKRLLHVQHMLCRLSVVKTPRGRATFRISNLPTATIRLLPTWLERGEGVTMLHVAQFQADGVLARDSIQIERGLNLGMTRDSLNGFASLDQRQESGRQSVGSSGLSRQEQSRLDQLQLHQPQTCRPGQNINSSERELPTI